MPEWLWQAMGSNRGYTGGGADGMTIDRAGAGYLNLRIQSNTIQQVETNGIAMGSTNSGPLAASIIGSHAQAEEGVQDSWIAVCSGVGKFEERSKIEDGIAKVSHVVGPYNG